jgi:uncharacterized protein
MQAGRALSGILALTSLFSLHGCTARSKGALDRPPSSRTSNKAMTLPGAEPHPEQLRKELERALAKKDSKYRPRTHHLESNGQPKFINRLILETSPYLLQHAHNPVNWFAWGPEAFQRAAKLGRPVLLSVGYSTCHWCHVMERESFEDEEIAAYINAHFVAIKVDREERPDIDSIYMTAVQMMTGRGGWPMTVVMTPNKEPFFGGTYFPPRDGARGARVGFLTILKRLHGAFTDEPAQIASQAQRLSQAVQKAAAPAAPTTLPGPSSLVDAAKALNGRFDPQLGGFGRAPKFPRPSSYELMLRYWRRTGDPKALRIVTLSLDSMIRGGIYDHLAGGFHRYSTDRQWLVPHFEKMLYDNAQLTLLLLEAYQATGAKRYSAVAQETLEYVAREMTSPEGGFYSATDADSEGHEGTFFVWTPAQIKAVLGDEQAKIANAYYGVTEAGNFEGKNILNRPRSIDEVAASLKIPNKELEKTMIEVRAKLLAARSQREHPLLDDKIIMEWNGQMISAFARGALVLNRPEHARQAERAATFILEHMKSDREGFRRTYRKGQARHHAVLEDHAFFIAGLLDLYETTGHTRWLEAAIETEKVQEDLFLDREKGAFFATRRDGEALLAREKPTYDGAQPSGNSLAALNLLRLYELTSNEHYRGLAEQMFIALGATLERGAGASPKLATGLDFLLDRPKEIVIVRGEDSDEAMMDVVRKTFLPNRVLVTVDEADATSVAKLIPFLEGKRARKGKTTAYVCMARVCLAPTSDPAKLEQQLVQAEALAKNVPRLP